MKVFSPKAAKRGFTLVELLVAMAITTLIILVLVSVTSVALDTWKRSRAEVRAAAQGKAMVDSMARDLEALVIRKGNSYQWVHAETPSTLPGGDQPDKIKVVSSNALDLIFFTSVTDRYDGEIGSSTDQGGDISCVSYKLAFSDPVSTGGTSNYSSFDLYRTMVEPKDTYEKLLAKSDLKSAFQPYDNSASASESFVCENVYQFTVTFWVEISTTTGPTTTKSTVPVTMGNNFVTNFDVTGSKITTVGNVTGATTAQIQAGRIVGAQISLTVISDYGLEQLRVRAFPNDTERAKFFAKNSFQYSKMVRLPGT